jgi:hypothetical protein
VFDHVDPSAGGKFEAGASRRARNGHVAQWNEGVAVEDA